MKLLLAVALLWLAAASASADVQRYAIIIANNRGHSEDVPLAYAESDADKVYAVLRELGGFDPLDMVLAKGEDTRTVRRALMTMNDRIRNSAAGTTDQSVLFVYYSGHADAGALRLGEERLELSELSLLVRGSAATFRLMVLDACRSGQVTRLKGGRVVDGFPLPPRPALRGEGLAFLTASAASEAAQESDEIRGSFFTHFLVTGLLGAADVDGDGAVALEEAYRYAYDATLRASSRTAYGLQHPSFEYDFRGHGSLVLTQPGAASTTRGTLRLPENLAFLVMRDHGDGPVVAELSASDSARGLSLRPGPYYLRGRAPGALLEGSVTLAAGQTLPVDPNALDRVEYARLVRKGGPGPAWSHALDVGPASGQSLPSGGSACWGGTLGYTFELQRVTLSARAATCTSEFANDLLRGYTQEYDASLAALYTWDLDRISLGIGLGAGATLAHQRFETDGRAPSRTSTAPYLALVSDVTYDLFGPWFLRLDVRAATQLATLEDESRQTELDVLVSLRAALLFGVQLGTAGR